jgi:deleted-in-malignant-brain-tumors protein 1
MLQMCSVAGSWTSVCGYSWNCNEAQVACKHLGYPSTYKPKYFLNVGGWRDMGYGPFTYCSTSYTKLTSCSNYTSSYRSSSRRCDIVQRTVFLQCVETKSECVSYSVRLVGGNDTSEGQVEICYGGRWYSFCGTSYMHNTFAATICNQLGFTSNNFVTFITDGRYGNTGSEIIPGSTYCSRPYNNIRSYCSLYFGSQQCIGNSICYNNRLGLKCPKSDNCNEGDVRLVNGTVEREGRLEVCASGIWGGICSGSSYFKRSAAYVACRQLGYTNTDGATIYSNSENTFGISNRPVVYTSVDCFGNERSIDKCVKTVGSSTCNTVGIRCLESCDNGELRLVGGNKSSEGTVEICLENYWYLVSTVGWDDKDAQVVCRQLKYNSGKAVLGSKYGKPKRPLAYRGVNCRGTEAELIDCSHHRVSSSLNTVVGNDSVAGVNCSGSIGSGIPQDVKFNTTTSLMCSECWLY